MFGCAMYCEKGHRVIVNSDIYFESDSDCRHYQNNTVLLSVWSFSLVSSLFSLCSYKPY